MSYGRTYSFRRETDLRAASIYFLEYRQNGLPSVYKRLNYFTFGALKMFNVMRNLIARNKKQTNKRTTETIPMLQFQPISLSHPFTYADLGFGLTS